MQLFADFKPEVLLLDLHLAEKREFTPALVKSPLISVENVLAVSFSKRKKVPAVLDTEELRKLLAELQNPARAMVFLTAATGLRVSETLGLKWCDVDWKK